MFLQCKNAALCRALSRNFQILKSVQTCVPRYSTKTPIQEWGWNYLMRQRALKRPISPHLTVYKPQLTWMLSGLHRITGSVMAGTLLIGSVGFALLPLDFTTFVDFVRGLSLPWVVYDAFKFIIAFPIIYHALNGIRFIGFDLAKGTDIASVYRSGYFVVGLAILISLALVVVPRLEQRGYVIVDEPKKK
ncbi:unnamed protein product [Thelazia callipaeda]|uniref:Succinate dehydrogenase cytochrome b560 subunit, mitochondrial n=1 Tax=Thelazia callipaeda TaxID=103827 RepID=A0A0N5D245_THECL|nr:unnamed protein product [Thelazia callipaeda]